MKTLLLIGRILFGGYFVFSGINHFLNLSSMAGYAGSKGVPMPEIAVALSGLLIVLGGVSVLLGYMPRIGLGLIVLFLVPVTLMMHNFWAVEDPQARMMEMGNFLKNVALIGSSLGLMAIAVPWPNSVERKRRIDERRYTTSPGEPLAH